MPHRLGSHPLIAHFLERMNLRGIVRSALGSGLQRGLDHAETLSIRVHNVLTSRGALYRVPEWAERIEPAALGLTGGQLKRLNDDRLARSLEVLSSARARSVFFRLKEAKERSAKNARRRAASRKARSKPGTRRASR